MHLIAESMVWITGGSAGLGAALVATVPFAGARVIDVSRFGGAPGAEHLPADLSEEAAWVAVEAHLRAQLGGFTGRRAVFVHCAGVLEPIGFVGEVDSQAYRRNVLLNSAAAQTLGHAFLAASAGADCDRHLVLISSGAAHTPYEGWSSYCAAKAAVDMWVRVVGAEQRRRPRPCQVLAVAPGVLDTAMQEQIRDLDAGDFPAVGRFRDLHATGALRDPADAARDIWSLLREDGPESGSVLDLREMKAR